MKSSKQSASTYWHPSFRNTETLPDTKVIRTSFAVNAAAVATVLALGAFMVTREVSTSGVREQSAELRTKIAEMQPRLAKAAELQKQFAASEQKLREVDTYVKSGLVASDFLSLISSTLPRLISLDSIEMSSGSVRLRGSVVGSSERSAPLAKAYAEQLAVNPVLKEQMSSIRLNNQNRDQAGDRFTFEIEMKLKSAAPAKPEPKRPARKTQDEDAL
jgi:Tfp pilus assembly protein PilN